MKNELVPYQEKEFDLESFNKETTRLNALNYNIFLSKNIVDNKSILDVVYDMQDFIHSSKVKNINKRLTNESSLNLVLEFYEKLGLKEKLEPIITGNNPLFNTKLSKNKASSFVSYNYLDPYITFNVGSMGTFYGTCNLAHECAHAINGNYTELSKFISQLNEINNKYGKDSEEFKNFSLEFNNYLKSSGSHEKDCIKEIESHIAEGLFVNFALNKNLISPEDVNVYFQQFINSTRKDISAILQEDYIYTAIRNLKRKTKNKYNDISENDYLTIKQKLLSKKHGQDFVNRLNFISKRINLNQPNNHSRYKIRYIIALVFSSVWLKDYSSSNKNKKKQKIEEFKDFLLNNNQHNLSTSFKALFPNETLESVLTKFENIILSYKQNLSK